jgi:hypothetical protein
VLHLDPLAAVLGQELQAVVVAAAVADGRIAASRPMAQLAMVFMSDLLETAINGALGPSRLIVSTCYMTISAELAGRMR